MKYIDADRLRARIEKELTFDNSIDTAYHIGRRDAERGILALIDSLRQEKVDMGEVSDGYHTFNELYYYRMLYNAAFFNLLPKEWVHKSKRHHDGEECFGGGWFIVMANLPTGQISNHYELKDWDLFKVPVKEFADEWDGHTPQEAAERLHKYLQQEQPEKSTKKNCNNCSHCVDRKDQYGWHFKGCFGGPYKGKFIAEIDECPLQQEQPEVDLEKEIERVVENYNSLANGCNVMKPSGIAKIALHFYELGFNARKA